MTLYGIWIAITCFVGYVWIERRAKQRGVVRDDIERLVLFVVPSAIVGARVHHVLTDWFLYKNNIWAVFAVHEGGLGLWGALILSCTVGVLVARYYRIDVVAVLEAVSVPLIFMLGIGRVANMLNGELLPFAYYDFSMLFLFGGVLLFLEVNIRETTHAMFPVVLGGYASIRFIGEFVRNEPRFFFGMITINQAVCGIVIVLVLTFREKYIKWKN